MKSCFIFTVVIFLIDKGFCESEEEREERERYCGIPHDLDAQTYSWLVALKFQAGDPGGSQVTVYYTGTLISNRYVVTAAENFDAEETAFESEWQNERYWAALPGVFRIDDIANYQSSDWIDINRIEIHPLYKGVWSNMQRQVNAHTIFLLLNIFSTGVNIMLLCSN